MEKQRSYQAPEILELGNAEHLTLGKALQRYPDNCGCTQKDKPTV